MDTKLFVSKLNQITNSIGKYYNLLMTAILNETTPSLNFAMG
ncbi:MAG: hypothetical protein V5786_01925 [Psychromonas sp.]